MNRFAYVHVFMEVGVCTMHSPVHVYLCLRVYGVKKCVQYLSAVVSVCVGVFKLNCTHTHVPRGEGKSWEVKMMIKQR